MYANPSLMGCYIPVIPGFKEEDLPRYINYECVTTPASIEQRAIAAATFSDPSTIEVSRSFVASAEPTGISTPYVNFGCYADTVTDEVFAINVPSDLDPLTIDVDSCILYCDARSYRFAAVYGTYPFNQCVCATDIALNLSPVDMRLCNIPCMGTESQQLCGGETGPLVYAKEEVVPNPWYEEFEISRANTITYSCGNRGKYLHAMFSFADYFPTSVTFINTWFCQSG